MMSKARRLYHRKFLSSVNTWKTMVIRVFKIKPKEANLEGVDITPNISLLHPLVQSRIWTQRQTAPSQTEVTDLNCSDHSTTWKSEKMFGNDVNNNNSNNRSGIVVWAVKIGDFRLARRRSS